VQPAARGSTPVSENLTPRVAVGQTVTVNILIFIMFIGGAPILHIPRRALCQAPYARQVEAIQLFN
jgi:hypothetical protein